MMKMKNTELNETIRANRGPALPLLGTLLLAAGVAGIVGCSKEESRVDNTVNELHDVAADAKDEIRSEAREAKDQIQDDTQDAKDEMKDLVDDQS